MIQTREGRPPASKKGTGQKSLPRPAKPPHLHPAIEHGLPDDAKTTFLLAMATPMIVLPIERPAVRFQPCALPRKSEVDDPQGNAVKIA